MTSDQIQDAARCLGQTNNLGNLGTGTLIWSPQGHHNIKHLVFYTGILSSSSTVLFAVGTQTIIFFVQPNWNKKLKCYNFLSKKNLCKSAISNLRCLIVPHAKLFTAYPSSVAILVAYQLGKWEFWGLSPVRGNKICMVGCWGDFQLGVVVPVLWQ